MTFSQVIGGTFALLFMTVSTWTAIRLLRMAMRTGQRPELLMAVGLLGTGTLGFGLSILAEVIQPSDTGMAAVLRLFGTLAISIAAMAFAVFTQSVFRGRQTWAKALVAVTSLALAVLLAVSVHHHWLSGPDRYDPAMLGRGVLLSLVWGWMGVECLRYRSTMRRRLSIGLADPIVVNRFTLWAFVSAESVVLNSISTWMAVVAGENAMNTEAMVGLTGALGMMGAVAIYLAFLPPRAYTRWVTESSMVTA